MKIFTDGSAKKNGKKDCVCGIGVYSDKLNLSMDLEECKQRWDWIPRNTKSSNNVGELLAIYAALVLSDEKNLIVYTDSSYSIGCITTWYKNWQKNNWQTSKKEDVKNREIIEQILLEKNKKDSVFFLHVNSHTKEPKDKDTEEYFLWHGNYMADKLATNSHRKQ